MNVALLVKPLLDLLLANVFFAAVALLLVLGLSSQKRAAYAVLKRNFLGYFGSPTGYVFLCLFVLLTSMAAFWPHEFFNSNLATLDQLNKWFPIIMLFFIPAITMSIWADEKRQGTDELLLTLPADDFDIVIGKYLAAASIYTVSLLFSQISTFIVLLFLSKGDVDVGLFFSNYLGYWFVGLAMLAIGMVASFLTHNLTVGFILGALFNAPFVFASKADVIVQSNYRIVGLFGVEEQFDNFGRGVISISSIAYFSLIVTLGLYFCMVLIGRRHWSGGKDGNSMFLHYFFRVVFLAVAVFAVSYFFRNNDRPRYDATQNQVSSLSPTTKNMIRQLKSDRPIVIDAYISADMPVQYAKTKYDLVNLLKEFQALSSRNVELQVRINDDLEPSSEEARTAVKQYGIEPQMVRVRERGAFKDQKILLGAAIRSGLSKVVIPFFESGIPVEYELVRSINTVSQPSRAKLGVIKTDAQLMGGFSMAGGGFSQLPKQPIIDELEKQYEVEEVDPSTPISTDKFDVLMAVQPSSLGPQEMINFLDVVKAGVPTAIFEDPMPFGFQGTPGTGEPKQAPGGGMFGGGGGGPQPKGDIQQLWKLLGLDIPIKASFNGINPDVVWQQYNPYPKLRNMMNATDEWIFIRENQGEEDDYLSEQNPITAGLRELMFLYAGAIRKEENRDELKITEIVSTRANSGRISFEDVQGQMRGGQASPTQLQVLQGVSLGNQVIGVFIETAKKDSNEGDKTETKSEVRGLKAAYIADIDCMLPIFSEIRKRPEQYEEIDFRFQNVTFILNVIDVLAGETRYPEIRRHEPQHSTLAEFEAQAEKYREAERGNQKEFQETFNKEVREAEEQNQKTLAKFQEKAQALQREGPTDPSKQQELISLLQQVQVEQAALERKLAVKREQLESSKNEKVEESRRQSEAKVIELQNLYKYLAIFLPPIPPLLVGAAVFVSRRVREREGISKNRLR